MKEIQHDDPNRARMKKWAWASGLVLAWLTLSGQTTYTNADIDNWKARDQGRLLAARRGHGLQPTATLPRSIAEHPYQEPQLVPWMLPYQRWDAQMRNYLQRHYHDSSLTFTPSAIVMHYTVFDDAHQVWNSFNRGCHLDAGDYGSVWGHASVQLMVDTDGTVYQLLPLNRRCTGAYGVNHKALSIEMVAGNEHELLSRPHQVFASLCLVRSLMRRYNIPLSHVYGHYEVSRGHSVVPEYLDYADSRYPDSYPPSSERLDPGHTYMSWLRQYIGKVGPAP